MVMINKHYMKQKERAKAHSFNFIFLDYADFS